VRFDDRTSYSTNFVHTDGYRTVTARPQERRNPIASFDVVAMETVKSAEQRNISGAVSGAWKVVRAIKPPDSMLIGGPGDF
jgi:hypothetical protein